MQIGKWLKCFTYLVATKLEPKTEYTIGHKIKNASRECLTRRYPEPSAELRTQPRISFYKYICITNHPAAAVRLFTPNDAWQLHSRFGSVVRSFINFSAVVYGRYDGKYLKN